MPKGVDEMQSRAIKGVLSEGVANIMPGARGGEIQLRHAVHLDGNSNRFQCCGDSAALASAGVRCRGVRAS